MKNWRSLLTSVSLIAFASGASAAELNIYAWSGEVPQEIVDDFAKETGITVTFDTYDSNETMMAKLSAGASGYDLIEPSQYTVQVLAKQGLLQELDHAKIPNLGNLGAPFKEVSYDPGQKWSVPYIWGTTGFAYNEDCVKTPPTSWKVLWDPQYEGRIYMLDNMLAAYIAGLQVNGFKAGTTTPAEIEKATQSLIEQKKVLGGYNSTNFGDLVASGEACIVQGWNGNIAQVMATNPKVKYVVPDEGGSMWIDGFAIPKSAKNVEEAYRFIDYIMRPEVAAKAANLSKSATVIDKAKALLPKEVVENTAIYPPEDKLMKADFILDVGDATKLYQDGWTKVKTAQ
ncbi:spermidine/putrescine ABC transporter substrate-binding protein [Shinella yambaruensis]|uniref:Putrescine-binding periplasmic protein n=1 Tax=Shinella yambaruensis TaxID=415996 RepID=A0ABQ5ZNF8_9HYPH|nr:spermidine/putrescine ABC transporter substrate-binding protein [Shinella yambaruensis]MCJ8027216.1 spermidine/putrescine ABC transporter substrate-binding protein [Shinella yambaruensis]MCU7981272.1 spermidine/putrescine ABC transporter substrate-binding protein [Shinella yambaruensis]GLR52571.1 putrescine-binding periplasmic protein [Shinella yambaruensis]